MRKMHREREIKTCGCITVHTFISNMYVYFRRRHEILISLRGFVQGLVDQSYPMKYKKIPKRMRRPFPQAREPGT